MRKLTANVWCVVLTRTDHSVILVKQGEHKISKINRMATDVQSATHQLSGILIESSEITVSAHACACEYW